RSSRMPKSCCSRGVATFRGSSSPASCDGSSRGSYRTDERALLCSVVASHALASRPKMSRQQEERVAAFRRLHEAGCFVMPNPWDVGSAVALEEMGFAALATTSAGNAWTLGVPDNGLQRDQTLAHLRQVADAVDVPVNADFEGGFADDPEEVAVNVKLAAETGVAGLSIEDSTGNVDDPLYPFDLAVDRVRAARRAIDESGTGVVLTG